MVQVAKAAVEDMHPMFLPLPFELEALLASGEYTPKTCHAPLLPLSMPSSQCAFDESSTPPATLRPPPGLTPPAIALPELKKTTSSESSLSGHGESRPATPYATTPPRRSSNKMSPTSSKEFSSGPEGVVMSVVGEVLSQDLWKQTPSHSAGAQSQDTSRWWTRSLVLCPLTGFPISLLPYPPFKLRVDPKKPRPHTLVDGKFLAMQVIVDASFVACDRVLQASDIAALDEYIHRCKLGPFRPGQALAHKKEAAKAESAERRHQASLDLDRLVAAATNELSKLRRIQENRLRQMSSKGQATPTQGAAGGAKSTGSHEDADGTRRRRVRTI